MNRFPHPHAYHAQFVSLYPPRKFALTLLAESPLTHEHPPKSHAIVSPHKHLSKLTHSTKIRKKKDIKLCRLNKCTQVKNNIT